MSITLSDALSVLRQSLRGGTLEERAQTLAKLREMGVYHGSVRAEMRYFQTREAARMMATGYTASDVKTVLIARFGMSERTAWRIVAQARGGEK